MKVSTAIIGITLISLTSAYKILGVFPSPEKSHWAVGEGIAKALSEAGHEVTVISSFAGNYPDLSRIKHIRLTGIYDMFMEALPEDLSKPIPTTVLTGAILYYGTVLFEETMKHDRMKAFLAESPTFDLVIVESFGTEAFYAFGEYFNAPIITTSTTLNTNWVNEAIGNVEPWSFIPNQLLNVHPQMGFYDRLTNVVFNMFEHTLLNLYSYPAQNKLMKKYFPKSTKSLTEVMKTDVCLAFINTHFTIALPRPYVPNMIEIGGINIDRKVKKLPEEFQRFLDAATDGVILFSMGSIFQASNLKDDQRQAFINVFAKLKQRVIWRYNLPDADKLPKNVMGREWLPQKEIMAHPNVILFITHGGMLGTTEGFYHGVPMIGVPMFGDQPVNMARAAYRGFAIRLDRDNLTESAIGWAVDEVLNNPKYRESVKSLSSAYHDQPMTPQETVVYWAEYVIKHKCARFMKIAGHQMGLIEYHNLDVWLLLVLIVVVANGLLWISCRKACKAYCKCKDKTKVVENKEKKKKKKKN